LKKKKQVIFKKTFSQTKSSKKQTKKPKAKGGRKPKLKAMAHGSGGKNGRTRTDKRNTKRSNINRPFYAKFKGSSMKRARKQKRSNQEEEVEEA